MQNAEIENSSPEYISDNAIILKKMRLLRRLTRQQAALLFEFSFKYIEKLENGRGPITSEKFKEFQKKYGFSNRGPFRTHPLHFIPETQFTLLNEMVGYNLLITGGYRYAMDGVQSYGSKITVYRKAN